MLRPLRSIGAPRGLLLDRLSMMTTSPGRNFGTKTRVTDASNHSPWIGLSSTSVRRSVYAQPGNQRGRVALPSGNPILGRSLFAMRPRLRGHIPGAGISWRFRAKYAVEVASRLQAEFRANHI